MNELAEYVGFTEEDGRVLERLRASLEPHFGDIVELFYEAIERNPRAFKVFTGGKPQIEHQKGLLYRWLQRLFSGEYGAKYVAARARIGHTHVRVGLDQRYMFTAMNIIRRGLHRALREEPLDEALREAGHAAVDKICDLELAIMLETYSDDLVARIRDKDRLATLGQMAGFIGHELRNPLAVMETSLHLLKRRLPEGDERAARHLRRLSEQVALSSSIISDLLELTRDRKPERDEVELRTALEDALKHVPAADVVATELQVGPEVRAARVDPRQLRHVVVNLVSNACQAMNGMEGERRVRVAALREGGALLLRVDDNGPGVDASVAHRLFEPLTTTRPKGLGLGLALCQRIAEKHGGSIRTENLPGGGARFEVRFADAFEDGT